VIRLLIAAPSAALRAGLEALVVSGLDAELVGSFPDLSAVESLHPDVVLSAVPLDEISPSADGRGPAFVLLLADASQPVWTREALRLGVRAVLPYNASAAEILAAVEAAASGLAVLEPRDLDGLLASVPTVASHEVPVLTARELEVFRMMADGAANKTIAWKLNIAEKTVKAHVAAILSKLNASNRTEAVSIGVRKGMILL
jgi:NarL family two-component system response regulator YdfI